MTPLKTLFVDIGGVLLTDGWNHHARERVAAHFQLEFAALNARHDLVFPAYEEGKCTLEEYLDWTVFHEQRPFTRDEFRELMFAQSKPYPEMIDFIARLKARHGLKVVVVSNEGRELNSYRIHEFKLNELVDAFISSCFVHLRKPDADIFRLALDVAQVPPEQVVYIENTQLFVEVAAGLGIRSILHTDYNSTRAMLDSLGLNAVEWPGHD